MGFRFQKRIKLFPGLTLNLSKSGASVSAGPRGAKVTLGPNGVRKTIGIPGTGLSHTEYTKYGSEPAPQENLHDDDPGQSSSDKSLGCGVLLVVGFAIFVCYLILK